MSSSKNIEYKKTAFLSKSNSAFIEEMYMKFINNDPDLPKSWTEYPTYKKMFENFRPIFYLLAKANLVPMSFYLKYCFPVEKAR